MKSQMKQLVLILLMVTSWFSFAQDDTKEKEQLKAIQKANSYVYDANELVDKDDYVAAEMEYRKAISEQPTTVSGTYNLGNSYYQKGNYEEALYRHQQAAKNAEDRAEKHKAFHNIGNILMKNEKCQEAVEAFKNALRNDPTDDETRYNLALAKECAERQQENNKDKKDEDENKEDNQDQEKEDQQNQDQQNQDDKDQGDQDEKDGDDKEDEKGKPKDDKKDNQGGDEKDKDQQKPQPQPGQLSPQQIKNLLEAMNNQEQKVQEKMNAEKQKGTPVKTDKDW